MNLDDFIISDNGDGTFTLTPIEPTIDIQSLLDEYRDIRNQGIALLDHRDQVVAKLLALVARRDVIRQLLIDAGYTNPDDDQ